jgi:hypothetical protein
MSDAISPRIAELRWHQEEWIRRKSVSALRFERSTAVLSEEFTAVSSIRTYLKEAAD